MTEHGERPDGRRDRSAVRQDLKRAFRRTIGLTALGTALPGAGLTRTRSRAIGWMLLSTFLLGILAIGYVLVSGQAKSAGLHLLSSAEFLDRATIGVAVLGVVWIASIIATAVQARPAWLDRSRSRLLAVFTVLMVAVIGTGTFKGAEYALVTKQTLDTVFSAEDVDPGQGAKVIVDEPDVDPWRDTPRVNLLLLGSDAGVGRSGTRTDSMIVASIDTASGRTALISLPRNLQKAPLPEASPLRDLYPSGQYGVPECFRGPDQCLLNAIWMEVDEYKANHPEAWQGVKVPGRREIRDVIEGVTGLHIDHTVIVDLKGFQELIDTMGGVDVNVKLNGFGGKVPIGGRVVDGQIVDVKGWFEPGLQHLNGYHALWYARSRAADLDDYRQQRQRCVIRAVVDQVNPAKMVVEFPRVAKILRENVYTDIPRAHLDAFVELIERVQKARISSVSLTISNGIADRTPDYDRVRALIQKAITPPKAKPKPTGTPTTSGSTGTSTPKPTTTTKKPAANVDECE